MHMHGVALLVAGRDREGYAKLRKTTILWPDRIDVSREYSLLLLNRGLFAEAFDVDLALANRYPSDPSMWSRAAVAALLAGRLDEARACVARATMLHPQDPWAMRVAMRLARGAPFPATLREFEQGR